MRSDSAPEILKDIGLPEGYMAVRCQFCGRWSSDKCPWTLSGQDLAKWGPLLPWGQGTRNAPAGLTCRICAIVFRKHDSHDIFLVLNQQLMSQVNDLLCWCPRFMSQEVGKKTMATSANAKPLCWRILQKHMRPFAYCTKLLFSRDHTYIKHPKTQRLRWQKQADNLVALKTENPGVRITNPEQLGPRTKLN